VFSRAISERLKKVVRKVKIFETEKGLKTRSRGEQK